MTTLHSPGISHEQRAISFEAAKQALANAIRELRDLPYITIEKQLELLEQVSQSDFGRFLIETGGLNGYWTHYIISHPTKGRTTGLNPHNEPFHPLEEFLLNRAPSSLATQQRFVLFKTQIQKHVCEGCALASIPSGLMGDLLELDFSGLSTFTLHGIDLDPETLEQAKVYALEKGLAEHCRFSQQDAWNLKVPEPLDLISCNGLTVYEPDDAKVIDLYRQLHAALKPGGILVTGFLTPPMMPGAITEWIPEQVNPQDAFLQKILSVDVLRIKCQMYRTEKTAREQLKEAGFDTVDIFYDNAHIFPTLVAKK